MGKKIVVLVVVLLVGVAFYFLVLPAFLRPPPSDETQGEPLILLDVVELLSSNIALTDPRQVLMVVGGPLSFVISVTNAGNGSMENLSFVLSPTLWDGNPITWSQEIGNNAVDVYVPLADDWAINPGFRYLIRLTVDFGWVVPQPGTWTITLINLQGI